jgi:hypothetical protein
MPEKQSVRSKKKTVQKPAATAQAVRRLSLPKRVWYKPLTWRYSEPAPVYAPLPKARYIAMATLRLVWRNWKLFGGIILIYGVLNIILVRGLSGSSDLTTLKTNMDAVLHGFGGKTLESLTGFGYLLTTSGSGNAASSGMYQAILLIICSLACIWALRQTLAKNGARIRDGFYLGMYPLVPFLLLVFLMMLQLLPALITTAVYQVITQNGIAVNGWEKALSITVLIAGLLWSLRMLTATIISLYIVTLPEMTPLRAYRSAKKLVYKRRLLVWRKIIFLLVTLVLLAAVIEIPLILWATPVAEWTFFILSMVSLPIVHGYFYNLYRDML